MRVHWVAVPQAMRARRANRRRIWPGAGRGAAHGVRAGRAGGERRPRAAECPLPVSDEALIANLMTRISAPFLCRRSFQRLPCRRRL